MMELGGNLKNWILVNYNMIMYLLNNITGDFQNKPIKYMDDDKKDDENIAKVLLAENELQGEKNI